MANLATLEAAQAVARTNYAAAADALVTAYVELFAVDQAICNGNIGGQPQPSFGGPGPDLPTHPIAYPNTPAGGRSFGDRIRVRLNQLLA